MPKKTHFVLTPLFRDRAFSAVLCGSVLNCLIGGGAMHLSHQMDGVWKKIK